MFVIITNWNILLIVRSLNYIIDGLDLLKEKLYFFFRFLLIGHLIFQTSKKG